MWQETVNLLNKCLLIILAASSIQVSSITQTKETFLTFTLWLTKKQKHKSAHHPFNDSGLGEKTEAEVHLTMDELDLTRSL